MSHLLAVECIRKSYSDQLAVDGLSFEIQAGQVLGLLGPNGAGKTTTMSIIAGLLDPDEGRLTFRNRPVERRSHSFRRALGVVPQELAIYSDLTAHENLVFFGRLYGLKGSKLMGRVEWALDRVGLTSNAHRHASAFSGGMKRRLNFAAAVLHQPEVLMLDEPTVGVDPQSRAHLLDCVRDLRDQGTSVIYASHYMEEVQAVCDRALIIDHGKALASGTIDELLEQVQPRLRLQIARGTDDVCQLIQAIDTVEQATESANGSPDTRVIVVDLKRTVDDHVTSLAGTISCLVDRLNTAKADILSLASHESNLERLFLELTGHNLRD